MSDKIFASGAVLRVPDDKPDFVVGRLGIKVDDFKIFLDEHVNNNGWVDLDLLIGKSGKPYVSLNQFKPERPAVVEKPEQPDDEDPASSIPF